VRRRGRRDGGGGWRSTVPARRLVRAEGCWAAGAGPGLNCGCGCRLRMACSTMARTASVGRMGGLAGWRALHLEADVTQAGAVRFDVDGTHAVSGLLHVPEKAVACYPE